MIAKERLLSLGWLLIALLNAQLLQAHADHHFHGNAYGGEGWSYAQPQRPFEYQHHTSHHRHGYHHNHHYNPTDAQIGHAPSFGGGQYGGGRANDLYAGQAGVGHPRDGVRRQGQASFGNPVWSRYPETAPTRPFEQRPLPPQQSNPLDYETDRRNPTGPLFQSIGS
ncbi:la-related protein Larp4B-like isoform X2 [Drosophila navojoa]|uniref:la-related protein Larp4B-like isoform X2 n=1 Tax=Drosophila navojoa TaxID=7232 RepID=UPI0011BF2962|nr:la-related protein Larp4B-like isoform X2 [Drosophila navojoa]